MKLAAVFYLTSKLIAWIGTFAACTLWLEINSVGDRAINEVVREISAFASQASDWLIDVLRT